LGNIIAFVKGNKRAQKRIMVDAHMDEVGFIVTYITADGMLKFTAVGGINTAVMIARKVEFLNGVKGVISSKPVHMLTSSEKEKMPDEDALYIDIGADSKQEAEAMVSVGDCAVFSEPFEYIDKLILSKAIDDRAGCWAIVDIINSEPEFDFYASFSVNEEVGAGARAVAFAVEPDFAIVAEATTAADIAGVGDDKKVCYVGGGAVLSFMDRGTLYEKALFDKSLALAKEKGIKAQVKSYVAGGNNAAGIHQSRNGVRTVAVSVPCRYIHSGSSVASLDDIKSVRDLIEALISSMASGEMN
jgi:endoglucanase